MKKRVIALVMAFMMVVGYVPTTAQAATKAKVSSVKVSNVADKTLVLKKGSSFSLKVKVTVSGKASKKVRFKSANKKIATVSKKGKIKALKNGATVITVTSKANKKKKVTLKVKVGTPVKSVSITPTQATAKVGDIINLTATVSPKKASIKKISFVSSDKTVATVNSKGQVSILKKGQVTITAKATDGNGKKAVSVITVNDASETTNAPATTEAPKAPTTTEAPKAPATTEQPADNNESDLSYSDYSLKWSDEFQGNTLNKEDWNVETHEAGWVNSELQEYVDSDENIQVEDGNLYIKPVKNVAEDGTVTYTSGRINTKGNQAYTYGLFEVRAKVPAGQGYLPAFWMMPEDENLYGQWPRCGEIDAMEVMGQDTRTAYGTIHYGNPHSQSQGTYTLENGDFSSEYHTYSCEWEPGKMKWYIDGHLYHEENDWYSATVGQGTVSYPAPFDQPFYMILNLAVGGSWVGNPDATTTFDDQAFVVDSVKAYQKDSYDENVQKPEKELNMREPDANGNYVLNGDFSVAEDLTDKEGWQALTTLGGEAEASIANNEIHIATTNQGTVDYSIQLVQAGVPLEKGATYEISFDAKAAENRNMKLSMKAPNFNYMEYMNSKTVDLTSDSAHYSYSFKMDKDTDDNGRLEFNMGAAGSTADIDISNVAIKMTEEPNPEIEDGKTVLADGNYIYNGNFQEGANRLGDWTIVNNKEAQIGVTNLADGRRFKAVVTDDSVIEEEVTLGQEALAINEGTPYALSFEAQADAPKTMKIVVGGNTFNADLTADKKSYVFKLPADTTLVNKDITFYLGQTGTIYLDTIRLVEDKLLKNGSFNAGMAGYEWYADSSADANYVIDSISEDNALDVTIKNTSDQDWKIQVKQNNVELEKNQWYKLTFSAKSSLARKIRVIMQGTEKKDYAVYSGENNVSLTEDYQTFEKTFQMKAATDPEAYLSICLGKINEVITTQHRVCIDDISLEKVDAPVVGPVEAGQNLLVNPDFSNVDDAMAGWTETIANWEGYVADATSSLNNGVITYDILNPGEEDWHVQLKQSNVALEDGATYRVTFDMVSTAARTVKTGVMSTNFVTYGNSDEVLEAGVSKAVSYDFTMSVADTGADFFISMGKIAGEDTNPSQISISNLKLVKVEE